MLKELLDQFKNNKTDHLGKMPRTVWTGNKWVVIDGGRVAKSFPFRGHRNNPLQRFRARHNWKVAIAVARAQAQRKMAMYRAVRAYTGTFAKYKNYRRSGFTNRYTRRFRRNK